MSWDLSQKMTKAKHTHNFFKLKMIIMKPSIDYVNCIFEYLFEGKEKFLRKNIKDVYGAL